MHRVGSDQDRCCGTVGNDMGVLVGLPEGSFHLDLVESCGAMPLQSVDSGSCVIFVTVVEK